MSELTKAILASILLIVTVGAITIGIMQLVYPPWGTVVDTSGMSAEKIELLERWME